jgi:hypothetical protein
MTDPDAGTFVIDVEETLGPTKDRALDREIERCNTDTIKREFLETDPHDFMKTSESDFQTVDSASVPDI